MLKQMLEELSKNKEKIIDYRLMMYGAMGGREKGNRETQFELEDAELDRKRLLSNLRDTLYDLLKSAKIANYKWWRILQLVEEAKQCANTVSSYRMKIWEVTFHPEHFTDEERRAIAEFSSKLSWIIENEYIVEEQIADELNKILGGKKMLEESISVKLTKYVGHIKIDFHVGTLSFDAVDVAKWLADRCHCDVSFEFNGNEYVIDENTNIEALKDSAFGRKEWEERIEKAKKQLGEMGLL